MIARGLTLLEVLAVAVLLALLAAALLSAGRVRGQSRARLNAAASALQTAEQRARLAAHGGGGAFRVSASSMWGEVAWPPAIAGRIVEEPLPRDVDLRLQVAGRPTDRLVYDTRGRSADADLRLRGAEAELSLRINGLTGSWTEVPP